MLQEAGPYPRRWASAARWLLVAGAASCAIGYLVMILVDVETVMGSGPVLFLLGVALMVVGAHLERWRAFAVGLAHVCICILFTVLVNSLNWSPGEAYPPFALMGGVYTLAMVPLSLWLASRIPREAQPDACVHCGYLLYGLTEPRCPECGHEFDPARILKLPPSTD